MRRTAVLYTLGVLLFYILKGTSPALALVTMLTAFSLPLVKYSYRYAVQLDEQALDQEEQWLPATTNGITRVM